ncbi:MULTISPECIES: hypothetical protein [Eubacterium]|uniref:hypothetical protein n=1 Tax=Eubacterium TaxID=1730 RepID=UPI001C11DC9C|nr:MULTISPECIES: hypothetical protein [Eubacterium]MBU5303171.1 hypothetical protein [Eubacterium callanderi]
MLIQWGIIGGLLCVLGLLVLLHDRKIINIPIVDKTVATLKTKGVRPIHIIIIGAIVIILLVSVFFLTT